MKKKRYLLILLLLCMPTVVFAKSLDESLSVSDALLMEAFVSIHMTIFVLIPLSIVINKDKYKSVCLLLFIVRALVLLFWDIFITPTIAYFDFMMVFVGAFGILPIITTKKGLNLDELVASSVKRKDFIDANVTIPLKNVVLKCNKCGSTVSVTDRYCQNCGEEIKDDNIKVEEDKSPVIEINKDYLVSEKKLLKNMIKEEINLQGENEKTFTINSLNKKKNILLGIFFVLTLICVIMYYFNYTTGFCIFIECLLLLIYFILSRRFNIINFIIRRAKKSPDTDISTIISEIKNDKKDLLIPSILKFTIVVLIALIIPSIYFYNPRVLYRKVNNEYYVLRYTKGIISNDEVIIPSTYKGLKVVGIGESAFQNSSVKKVSLPEGLESIKAYAFYNCRNISEITIPSTVTEIRASAFQNDVNLTTVNLSEGIKEIRGSAFKNCTKLINIYLPESLEYLGASAFSYCSSLYEITIPKKVTEINGQTFEYCTSLRVVNLHDDIVSIHGETFVGDTSLVSIILPSKITEIRGNTFEGCTSLASIVIPDGVTRIGGHAFYGCSSLSSVIVPSTVLEIGSSAFRHCYSLTQIRIPSGTYVNERAFKESPTVITRY